MNTKFDVTVTDRIGAAYQIPLATDVTEVGEPILIIPAYGHTDSDEARLVEPFNYAVAFLSAVENHKEIFPDIDAVVIQLNDTLKNLDNIGAFISTHGRTNKIVFHSKWDEASLMDVIDFGKSIRQIHRMFSNIPMDVTGPDEITAFLRNLLDITVS